MGKRAKRIKGIERSLHRIFEREWLPSEFTGGPTVFVDFREKVFRNIMCGLVEYGALDLQNAKPDELFVMSNSVLFSVEAYQLSSPESRSGVVHRLAGGIDYDLEQVHKEPEVRP